MPSSESPILDALEKELPDRFWDHLDELADQLFFATGAFYHSSSVESAMAVFNHATNDIFDLIDDCLDGRGRTAARTARALYEHAVNMRSVSTSSDMANRYEQHRWVTEDILARRQPGLSRLSPERARVKRQAYSRMSRRSRAALRQPLAKYGSGFRKTWTSASLYDRAAQHGLALDYEAYRVLSTVVHGTPGGLTGTRATIRGESVHRTGPNLELASLAWLEGLTFFQHFVEALPLTSDMDCGPLSAATNDVLDDWPELDHALLSLDRQLWPDAAPARDVAVLAFYPTGTRWYYYHTASEQIITAEPPADAESRVEVVRRSAGRLIDAHEPDEYEGRPFTVIMWGVTVLPRRNTGGWRPAEAVLTPRRLLPDNIDELIAEQFRTGQ